MIYFFLTGTQIHRRIELPNVDRAIAYRDEAWPKAKFGQNQPQIAVLIEESHLTDREREGKESVLETRRRQKYQLKVE